MNLKCNTKTIWMCWFQGENDPNMSKLNKECISRWKKLNPDWQVNILRDETIANFVPEYFDLVNASPERNQAAKADLLRLLLLSKYGGVWVDVSVYPMLPLSEFYDEIVNETGFFAYRFIPRNSYYPDQGLCETSVWFIVANAAKNYLIDRWKERYTYKFQNKKNWKYMTLAQTLCDLYDADKKVKSIVDNMIQISEEIPHSAHNCWKSKKDSYMYKRPNLFNNND